MFSLLKNDYGPSPLIELVPILSINTKLPETVKEVIEDSNGASVLRLRTGDMREGVVWRSMTDPTISFKAKSPEYAIWFEGDNKRK